jgi:hypothetical protein
MGIIRARWTGWLVATALIALGVAGCSSVTLTQPLPGNAEAARRTPFEGDWISGDQVVHVRFDSTGTGRFAGVDWKRERFQLDQGEFIISRGARRDILSARIQEDGRWEPRYFFARYRFTSQGDLVLWFPRVDAFRKAIEQGHLVGTAEAGRYTISVTITSPPEVVLRYLDDPAHEGLFDLEDPLILKRLMLTTPSRPRADPPVTGPSPPAAR